MNENFRENLMPLILFIIFFFIQIVIQPSELILTALIIIFSGIIFWLKTNKGEIYLLASGLLLGGFIEVFLGLFGRQQFWENASLFGVPYWLPIAWGIGFVIITRLGIKLRELK